VKRHLILTSIAAASLAGCASSKPAPTPAPASNTSAAAGKAAPKADPAPVVDGDVTTGTVHGIQVIVKRNPGAELVAADLIIRGGVRNWTDQNAGIEALLLSTMATGGTESMPKDQFSRKLASLGTDLGGSAGNDYSALAIKCLLNQFDPSFDLLADAFLHPALPAPEVELQRQRQLSELKHEQESPDGQLSLLTEKTIFAGHPYARRAIGTDATVKGLTREQLVAHLKKLQESGRLLLVIVGDVDAKQVMARIADKLGGLPAGTYQETEIPRLAFAAPKLDTVQAQLPTNYIHMGFAGSRWSEADFAAGMVAIRALDHRLFEEVRTKRNLSYAPHASINGRSMAPAGFLYVTAVDPNTTVGVMLDEVKKMQVAPLSEVELAGTKSVFVTGFMSQGETTDGQADLLAATQIYAGDWHWFRKMPEAVRAVTAKNVQDYMKARVGKLQVDLVGDPTKLDPKLAGSL
jgi:zinc protease